MDLKLLKKWINVISRIQIQSRSKGNNKLFKSFLPQQTVQMHGSNMTLNGDLK